MIGQNGLTELQDSLDSQVSQNSLDSLDSSTAQPGSPVQSLPPPPSHAQEGEGCALEVNPPISGVAAPSLQEKGTPSRAESDSVWVKSEELWYAAPSGGTSGRSALSVRPMPDNLSRNDIVGAVLTAGLLLLLLVLGQTRRKLRKAVIDFLFPVASVNGASSSDHSGGPSQETFSEYMWRFTWYVLLVIGLTVICYLGVSSLIDVSLLSVTPNELLLLFLALVLVFVLSKSIAYRLVHWTFFSRMQREAWRRQATLLFSVESMLVFPLAAVFVFLCLPLRWLALSLIFVLLFVKIPLTLKAKSIFFPRFGGSFHLFVYLCALEIAPYLLLVALIAAFTTRLASP